MKYRQLTSDERYMISTLRKEGFCSAEIARVLGRQRSTITREIHRNSKLNGRRLVYWPSKAVQMTNGRRRRSRRNRQFCDADFAKVVALLREDWSPEQISAVLRANGELHISHETIYRYIWNDKAAGGTLYKHLRQATRRRRKCHNTHDSRGRLAGKRMIDQRPASVESRRIKGHWEIDTVIGGGNNHCIVTLVERKTGYLLIGKLRNRTTAEMNRRIIKLIRRHELRFSTITADNGTEFHAYVAVERQTGVKFYFAYPYHSWQRGSNENANGLVRQYFPKRTSMAHITQQDCDTVMKKLNTRPRKRFGFKTPEEMMHAN
jgi:transposase, IS30 family